MIEDNKILFYKERTSEDLPYTSLNFLYAKTVSVDESKLLLQAGCFFCLKTDIIVKDVLIHMKILKEDVIDRGSVPIKTLRIIDLAVCDVLSAIMICGMSGILHAVHYLLSKNFILRSKIHILIFLI